MRGWIAGACGLTLWAGCGPVSPCDEYVDYMCACHGDEIDCDELSLTYDGAAPAVQDECAVLLDDQEQADRDAGEECASE